MTLPEHIWWDQATVLLQVGAIPTCLPYPYPGGNRTLRLPVAGIESARLLADETDGNSNEMLGSNWGVSGQSSDQALTRPAADLGVGSAEQTC